MHILQVTTGSEKEDKTNIFNEAAAVKSHSSQSKNSANFPDFELKEKADF